MQRLVKNQYEAIASVLRRGMEAREGIPEDNLAYKAITEVITTLVYGYCEIFEESDPGFKVDEFIKLSGVE